MKKIESGQGASDLGSTEKANRPINYDILPSMSEVYATNKEIDRERIVAIIHQELVKYEVGQKKYDNLGFIPLWVYAAADAIIAESQ